MYLAGGKDAGSGGTIASAAMQSDFQSGRHFGGVNVGFADGHAKWLRSSVVVAEAKKPADPAAGRPQPGGAWRIENS